MPLRRYHKAARQFDRRAEKAVGRMTLGLAVKLFLDLTLANKMLSQSGRGYDPPDEPTGC